MTKYLLHAALLVLVTSPLAAHAADAQRQAEVAKLGADVMPFSLKATTHIFTKTAEGGIQRVVAKSAIDTKQVRLVREHLHDIQTQFLRGDFSGPSHIHGNEMPGLAELKSAKPGQIAIEYKDVDGGAELTYRTADARLVAALHEWFDAQLSDHGADAMAGHMQHHQGVMSTETAVRDDPSKVDEHMKMMMDMHQRMQAAKTPEERAALMTEHMKSMQDGTGVMPERGGLPMPDPK